MNCINCNIKTSNPKFCSRSCSSTYNNKKSPKRKKEGICKSCNCQITSERTYCKSCSPVTKFLNKTLGELKTGNANSGGYPQIRSHARRTYINSGQLLQCLECGYSRHVEICHVIDIKSHSLTDTVAKINSLNNLIALCKNCHWEFDNGYLGYFWDGEYPFKKVPLVWDKSRWQ